MYYYVILGKSCNLHCKYCNQHYEDTVDVTVNPKVYEAIEKDKPSIVVFYGGEPLMYWDAVKEIVENTNTKYAIITNGTLLDEEKVAYLNEHNFFVTISWDGNNVTDTRGVNVIETKKDLIMKIQNLNFNGVITTKNYPLDYLDAIRPIMNEYKYLNKRPFGIHLDMVMDDGVNFNELSDFDTDKLVTDMKYICDHYENIVFGGEHDTVTEGFVNRHIIDGYEEGQPCCGVGYSRKSINLKGEAVLCQGDNTVIGNIEEAFETARSLDMYPERYDGECASCEVKHLCNNGCQLYSKKEMERYCQLRKLMFKPMMEMVSRINSRLERLGFQQKFREW